MLSVQRRILCIDNRASRNLAVYLLGLSGYEVKTASSIAEAVSLSGKDTSTCTC
jgi:CheY-like chemotaxis protein